MWAPRRDPGPCPICGVAHTACTARGPAEIVIDQLPARTELARTQAAQGPPEVPPVEFSTATYERAKHGAPGKRKP